MCVCGMYMEKDTLLLLPDAARKAELQWSLILLYPTFTFPNGPFMIFSSSTNLTLQTKFSLFLSLT